MTKRRLLIEYWPLVAGLATTLLTAGGWAYTAGIEKERSARAIERLQEQIDVLKGVEVSEHPDYSVLLYPSQAKER